MGYIQPKYKKGILVKEGYFAGSINSEPVLENQKKTLDGFRTRMLKKPTEAEKKCYWMLSILKSEVNIHIAKQKVFIFEKGLSCIVDCYTRSFHTAIEIDGPQHSREKNASYDEWRTNLLNKYERVNVIRFTNAQILKTPKETFFTIIHSLLKAPRAVPYYRAKLQMALNRGAFSKLKFYDNF